MAQIALPVRWLSSLFQRAATDSLVRNSLYLMASTVSTAALGYVYWILAAHIFAKQEVGVSSAVVSMCATISLLTYLGPSAMLVEQLPPNEHSSEWTAILYRVCTATATVTGLATVVIAPAILVSRNYHTFYVGPESVVIAVLYAGMTTVLSLLGAGFVAARRAGRLLAMQTLVSVAKIILLFPLANAGALGVVETWVISAVLGVTVGIVWLVPQMGLGRQTHYRARRSKGTERSLWLGPRQGARHRRGRRRPDKGYIRRLAGRHLTGVGGALTPLLLPVLVVMRLGDASNADFYMTWMMGSVFFMVSPSVSAAIFAEGVRVDSDLRREVSKALKMNVLLMVPAILIMIAFGKVFLSFFGESYIAGYELLIVFAISAIPDAVSNVAVAVCQVTRHLGYSAALNLGILVTTLAGAWVLMPWLGINGAGVAWGGAQLLSAIASVPVYTYVRRGVGPLAFLERRTARLDSAEVSAVDGFGPPPYASAASQRAGIDALIAIASAVSTGPMPAITSVYETDYELFALNRHAPEVRIPKGSMSERWLDRDMGGKVGLSPSSASQCSGDVGGDRRQEVVRNPVDCSGEPGGNDWSVPRMRGDHQVWLNDP